MPHNRDWGLPLCKKISQWHLLQGALTEAETRYPQIEKELLAVVFAFSRFHQYVYGTAVTVESDHKPLEAIVKKQLSAAPPRLQRMLLQLQKYTFTLVYRPGKEILLADTLSRAYLDDEPASEDLNEDLICAVNQVLNYLLVSDTKLNMIRQATASDPIMLKLQDTLRCGWPDNRSQIPNVLRPYWTFREELSEANGIILKGEKIVIPNALKKEMLAKIHTSHLVIVKCKQRAKDVLFWPGMGRDIEELVSKCDICSQHQPSNPKEPMLSEEIPTRPWELVSTDLFCLDGEDYLLIVDSYSHYIAIAKLSTTSSKAIVESTKSVFAQHGIPTTVKSDNGPQFTAAEYKEFSKSWGFKHVTVSPHYPQANGLAEKSVHVIKQLLKKATADKRDPYLSLLEYRNTAVNNIGSPAQLTMNRRLNSVLPCTPQQLAPQIIEPKKVMEAIQKAKEQNEKYYNRSAKSLSRLKPKDHVRIQMNGEWVPGTVKGLAGTPRSYIVAGPGGREYRRNRKHLRKACPQSTISTSVDDENDDVPIRPVEQDTIEQDAGNNHNDTGAPPQLVTSRERVVRVPARYNDFVKQ